MLFLTSLSSIASRRFSTLLLKVCCSLMKSKTTCLKSSICFSKLGVLMSLLYDTICCGCIRVFFLPSIMISISHVLFFFKSACWSSFERSLNLDVYLWITHLHIHIAIFKNNFERKSYRWHRHWSFFEKNNSES